MKKTASFVISEDVLKMFDEAANLRGKSRSSFAEEIFKERLEML